MRKKRNKRKTKIARLRAQVRLLKKKIRELNADNEALHNKIGATTPHPVIAPPNIAPVKRPPGLWARIKYLWKRAAAAVV